MATVNAKTVNLSDLSEVDQKILGEYNSLIKELFLFTPLESSSCVTYKEDVLNFLEMYKSVFSEDAWKVSKAEVLDQELLQFRESFRKLFQENAYICLSKFPPAPKFLTDEAALTNGVSVEKRMFCEYNWIYRINVIKRETFLKSLKTTAMEEFQKKVEVSFLTLINEIEVVYDEDEFRKKRIEIQNASVEKLKSQISSDEGILAISLVESELQKAIFLNKLSEETKKRFLEATENAAEKVSNTLKRCKKQCNDRAKSFSDDVEVIFNISGIPEIYKSQIQGKLETCVNNAFEDIEAQSIVKYKNCEKLLSIFNAQGITCKPKKLEIGPSQHELPQKTILRTLPPAPGHDEKTTKTIDDQVSSKIEAHPKNSETTSAPFDVETKSNFEEKTNNMFVFGSEPLTVKPQSAFPEASKLGFSFGTDCSKNVTKKPVRRASQRKTTTGLTVTPSKALTFNKNFDFDQFWNKNQQPSSTSGPLVTKLNKITLGNPEHKMQHDKQNSQIGFSFAQPLVKTLERDLPPLCIHLQDSQIQVGMMINGEVQILRDEFCNSLIPAVVAYTKQGQFLYGSQVDTCDIFQLLKCIWWLLKPTQGNNHFFPEEISFQGKLIKVTYEFLLAFIFRKIKLQVEREMRGSCKKALIVVPLHFTSVQRTQVKHSAEIAGFSESRLFDEPSAISCAYSDDYKYKGKLMVLSENSKNISASCMFISTDSINSATNRFNCVSCNNTGFLDKANFQVERFEIAVRNACLEASKRYKNKFVSDFRGKLCIICKADSKSIPILEKVGQEFGNGEVRIYSSAIAGAALLGNSPSKHELTHCPSVYDLVIESDKTGKAQTFDVKTTMLSWFKHIVIDGTRASIYQVDIANKRIPVVSLYVENVTNDEVVEFNVDITGEGILNVMHICKRSSVSSVAPKLYLDGKDIKLSTPNISRQEVLQCKFRLADIIPRFI